MSPTTKNIFIPLALAAILLVVVLAISNYKKKAEEEKAEELPKIEVLSPESEVTIESDQFTVKGKTDSDAKARIQGEEVTVNEDGTFEKTITLDIGENVISIETEGENGKLSTTERVITRTLPAGEVVEVPGPTPEALSDSGPETLALIPLGLLTVLWYLKRRSSKELLSVLKK